MLEIPAGQVEGKEVTIGHFAQYRLKRKINDRVVADGVADQEMELVRKWITVAVSPARWRP